MECSWLPDLVLYEESKNWSTHEDFLYSIFWNDFIKSFPYYNNRKVNIREFPIVNDKEEAFYHVTCKDYGNNGERSPDLRRCERIRWVRAFIENHNCNSSFCIDCDGVKIWKKLYPPTKSERIHFLFEEERYIVVLEERTNYYLLITAFYLEYRRALEKKLTEYEEYRQKTENASK